MHSIQGKDVLSCFIVLVLISTSFYFPLLQERSSLTNEAYRISCKSDSTIQIADGIFSGRLNVTKRETSQWDYWDLVAYHERRSVLTHQNLTFSIQTSYFIEGTLYAVNETTRFEVHTANYTSSWNSTYFIDAGFSGFWHDTNSGFEYDSPSNSSQVYILHWTFNMSAATIKRSGYECDIEVQVNTNESSDGWSMTDIYSAVTVVWVVGTLLILEMRRRLTS